MILNRIYRAPGTDNAGGGDTSIPDPTLTGGTGSEGGSQSQRDYGRDIESIRGEFGGFKSEFQKFTQDFSSRFPAPQNKNQDEPEPKFPENGDAAAVRRWVAEHSAWNGKRAARDEFGRLKTEQEQTNKTQTENAKWSSDLQAHIGRMGEARGRYKDFDTVIASASMTLPKNIQAEVMDSDVSADLHYMLSKNQGDLYKVLNAYNTSPSKGARVLGELETRIRMDNASRAAAEKKAKFGATGRVETDSQGSESEEQEFENIARERFGLKKK